MFLVQPISWQEQKRVQQGQVALLGPSYIAPVALKLLHAIGTDGTIRVSLATSSSKTYWLEYKDSLSEIEWKALTSVTGDGNEKVLTDPSPAKMQRFYRARVE